MSTEKRVNNGMKRTYEDKGYGFDQVHEWDFHGSAGTLRQVTPRCRHQKFPNGLLGQHATQAYLRQPWRRDS